MGMLQQKNKWTKKEKKESKERGGYGQNRGRKMSERRRGDGRE